MNITMDNSAKTVNVTSIEPPFPMNVCEFGRYTTLRGISMALFLLLSASFLWSLYVTQIHDEAIKAAMQGEVEGRGYIKRFGIWTYEKFWQKRSDEAKLDARKSSILFWSLTRMLMSWCLVWLCFDWNTVKNFIFAAATISLGAIYSILPVDAIPDFIPVAGGLDDLTVNLFGSGLGVASIMEYYKRKKQKAHIISLISRHPDEAVSIVLEDYNLKLKK